MFLHFLSLFFKIVLAIRHLVLNVRFRIRLSLKNSVEILFGMTVTIYAFRGALSFFQEVFQGG